MSIQIAPSLLAADFTRLSEQLKEVESGGADLLHLDVMDGQFVPPISFGEIVIEKLRSCTSLFLETHLMTVTPSQKIDSFIAAGSQRIIFHQEAEPHLHRTLEKIKQAGASTGIAINPGTPIQTLQDVLPLCDVVLLMSVNPGWGGQKFIPSTIEKIRLLLAMIQSQGASTIIELDGGIDVNTIGACRSAGATCFVAGSALFGRPSPLRAIKELREAAERSV